MTKPSKGETPTRVDSYITWAKNNRITAVIIIAATLLAGIATFADSVRTLASTFMGASAPQSGHSVPDAELDEQLRKAASVVLAELDRGVAEPVLDYRAPTAATREIVESELRKLALLYQTRGMTAQANAVEASLVRWREARGPFPVEQWKREAMQQRREEWRTLFDSLGYNKPN
jgi:hypothetical protein